LEGKINFFFDEEGDMLDITIGKPRKAVAKELKNDIAIRVDPESGEIVGIVILNFMKRFRLKKKPEKIELPLKITITTS
jgi:uncharacterized protein YuzE